MLNFLKKILQVITTIIMVGELSTGNYAYALGEAKDVESGVLTINSKKIFYKYDGIENGEKEIKNHSNQSIWLFQETLQALFVNSNKKSFNFNFNFNYLVDGKAITRKKDITELVSKNILFTGTNTRIKIGRGTELNLGSFTL